MKSSRVLLWAGATSMAFAAAANATVIVNDTFDTYADQAAFNAVWVPYTAVSANLTNAQAASAPNSVGVPGSTSQTTNDYRVRHTFAETTFDTTTQLVFSFDFYDSAPAASPARNYVNLQDSASPGATNQLVSLGLNNNQTASNSGGNYYMARILGYNVPAVDPDGGPNESVTGSGAYFKLNDFGVGLRSAGWHNLKVVMSTSDGTTTDYEFYVDGQLAERVSGVGTVIRSYDNIAIGSGLTNANTAAYFDNIRLEVVPEPATIGLLALGGLFLRRRQTA
jgi:hypothetical protein